MTILYTTGAGNRLVVSRITENDDGAIRNNKHSEDTSSTASSLSYQEIQVVDPIVEKLPPGIAPDEKRPNKLATEWVSLHPTQNVLVTLTSFWNKASAVLTVFDIVDKDSGRVQKRSQMETGGYQACQGVWSSDGKTYVVPHHNGGKIAWFDVPTWKRIALIDLPAVKPKIDPKDDWLGVGNPSCHGVAFTPQHLIAVDPRQDLIITYPVDAQGRLQTQQEQKESNTAKDSQEQQQANHHSSLATVQFNSSVAWFNAFLFRVFSGKSSRPRRAVPHGKYLYVLSENSNAIQVLPRNVETGEVGSSHNECLQELKLTTVDSASSWWVGPALIVSAELHATPYGLIVSVRGKSLLSGAGYSESGIYFVDFVHSGNKSDDVDNNDNGQKLQLGCNIPIPGMIRHFLVDEAAQVLWVANETAQKIYKYQLLRERDPNQGHWRQSAKFLGEFDVGVNPMCIAATTK